MRKDGNAGRRLGLSVHDEESSLPPLHDVVKMGHERRLESAAGLGQRLERCRVQLVENQTLEHLIGVRNARHRRAGLLPNRGPEGVGGDGLVGQHDGGTGKQVRVEHGEPVRVIERQIADRSLRRCEAKGGSDGLRVGAQIRRGEPNELRTAGRS